MLSLHLGFATRPYGANTQVRASRLFPEGQILSKSGLSPDLFFPVGNTGPAVEEIQAAKAVCQGCQVQDACLQFALETNQEAGIWGGSTEDERRRLRRAWLAHRRRQTRVNA